MLPFRRQALLERYEEAIKTADVETAELLIYEMHSSCYFSSKDEYCLDRYFCPDCPVYLQLSLDRDYTNTK